MKSVKELVALAKRRPGELNYASGGTGNITHLAMELFVFMTGVNMVHIPSDEIVKALDARDLKQSLTNQGIEPAEPGANEFARFMAAEIAKWAKVVKAAGIPPQ